MFGFVTLEHHSVPNLHRIDKSSHVVVDVSQTYGENERSAVILPIANKNTGRYGLKTDTHCFLVLAKQFGAGQELVVLAEGDDRFRKLPQIELQQRCHCVHVGITARREIRNKITWKRQCDKEEVIKQAYGAWNHNHSE